jgi:GAF domain-containing protein
MKVEPPNIKVLVSSESPGNPYEQGELASLNTGLYCETVMKTRQPLFVPDALADEKWNSNPDIKLGMTSYRGFPIRWPNGDIFGTICVLDNKRNDYSDLYRKLLLHCRDVLETDLRTAANLGERLQLLLNLTSRVTSSLDLREVVRAVAANLREVIHADAVVVALPDAASEKFRIFAMDFPHGKGVVKEEVLVTPGAAYQKAMDTLKPVVIDRWGPEELGPDIYDIAAARSYSRAKAISGT